jgi:DNA-binding Xre family transcriptional regulator
MPTRLCLKNTGKPSSKNITNATIKKIGENRKRRIKAKSLLNICLKYYTAKLMKIYDAKNYY